MAATSYAHLARLTTSVGLYEHALGDSPRRGHGMCVDDAARALVVAVREPDHDPTLDAMARTYLDYVVAAQTADGATHNRSDDDGRWIDEPSTGDHWGRSLWALGTAARQARDAGLAEEARAAGMRALPARSAHPRAMAYAALGAADLLRAEPSSLDARRLLHDARALLPAPDTAMPWAWPYARLTYANAVLPQAMIAVGGALHDQGLRREGLALLAWLRDEQLVDGHLSPVPTGGRGPGDPRPGFDQQPIEVAALAEAAATAWDATRDPGWLALLTRCRAWFAGDNDCHLPMCDPATGGGCDGLEDGSVNSNQGAESTLAWLAVDQLSRALDGSGR